MSASTRYRARKATLEKLQERIETDLRIWRAPWIRDQVLKGDVVRLLEELRSIAEEGEA